MAHGLVRVGALAAFLAGALTLACVDAHAGSRSTITLGAVVVAGGTCQFTAARSLDNSVEVPFSCTRGPAQTKSVRYALDANAATSARYAGQSLTITRSREPAASGMPESVVVTITP